MLLCSCVEGFYPRHEDVHLPLYLLLHGQAAIVPEPTDLQHVVQAYRQVGVYILRQVVVELPPDSPSPEDLQSPDRLVLDVVIARTFPPLVLPEAVAGAAGHEHFELWSRADVHRVQVLADWTLHVAAAGRDTSLSEERRGEVTMSLSVDPSAEADSAITGGVLRPVAREMVVEPQLVHGW